MTERITAEDFDKAFDEGEDISTYVDWDHPVSIPPIEKRCVFTVRLSEDDASTLIRRAKALGQNDDEYASNLVHAALT